MCHRYAKAHTTWAAREEFMSVVLNGNVIRRRKWAGQSVEQSGWGSDTKIRAHSQFGDFRSNMSVSFCYSHFSLLIVLHLQLPVHLDTIRQQMTLQCPQSVYTIRYFTPYPNCSIRLFFKFQDNEQPRSQGLLRFQDGGWKRSRPWERGWTTSLERVTPSCQEM